MKNRQFVVCRFNEDISWTEWLDEDVLIYNKGEIIQSKHRVINLPNLGMFHGTQLYHIVENYENLADVTVFLQGWPFDAVIAEHYGWDYSLSGLEKILSFYLSIGSDKMASTHSHVQLVKDLFEAPPNYNQRHHNEFVKYTFDWYEWLKIIDPKSKVNWDIEMPFFRNGQIGLSKKAILSNPKEFYILLLDHWKYSNPVAEWATESTQHIIFNSDIDENFIDYEHESLDFSNLKNYKEWIYEIK